MKPQIRKYTQSTCALITFVVVVACSLIAGTIHAQSQTTPASTIPAKMFATPEEAADALIEASDKYDVNAIEQILGTEGKDLVITGEVALDKEVVKTFADLAREKKSIPVDPKTKNRAILIIGKDDWPFSIPIAKKQGKWYFDVEAGRVEMTNRRVGQNELNVIQICHGFVEAQEEYSLEKHDGSPVNQYAQRIISTPGKQDGLAWQDPDGTWKGPIGENAAKAIETGFSKEQPYRGYYFKVLKGQGPYAPLGQMDYIVNGYMIGGFALAAAPAEYAVTGVKTFIVSNDGVVYEKDLGDATPEEFKKMEVFNPDKTWDVVTEE